MDLSDESALFRDLHFSSTMITNMLSNPILGKLSILFGKYIYFPPFQEKFENKIFQKIINTAKEYYFDEETNNTPLAVKVARRNLLRNISPHEQRAEMAEVLYVGSHTLGLAVSSCLVCMATNPEVQQKLWLEQQEIFGNSNRDPTHDDIKRMLYLDRFFKEVLRFVAPPIIVRKASEDLIIDGLMIPEGSVVTIGTVPMRHNSRYWDNPQEFNPDRFLNENISKTPKAASTFFGFGIRGCPGTQFASNYVRIFLSTIIRNLKLYSSTKFTDIQYKYSLMVEMKDYTIGIEKRKCMQTVKERTY